MINVPYTKERGDKTLIICPHCNREISPAWFVQYDYCGYCNKYINRFAKRFVKHIYRTDLDLFIRLFRR